MHVMPMSGKCQTYLVNLHFTNICRYHIKYVLTQENLFDYPYYTLKITFKDLIFFQKFAQFANFSNTHRKTFCCSIQNTDFRFKKLKLEFLDAAFVHLLLLPVLQQCLRPKLDYLQVPYCDERVSREAASASATASLSKSSAAVAVSCSSQNSFLR